MLKNTHSCGQRYRLHEPYSKYALIIFARSLHSMQSRTKAFLKAIMPPILVSLFRRWSVAGRPFDFAPWWASFRSSDAIPTELLLMVDHYLSTADSRESSEYWNWLCRLNIEQIVTHGLSNFRQTVAKNYFTWIGEGFDAPYVQNLVREVGTSDASAALAQVFKKHDLLTIDESVQYNLMTVLLYDYYCRTAGCDLLARIDEPTFGKPPVICHRWQRNFSGPTQFSLGV